MIGGNITAKIQINKGSSFNVIGEQLEEWVDVQNIEGFLDLSSGDSKYTTYYAKLQESTHVFICDFVNLDESIKAENSRLIVDGKIYDVLLIDDPMNLHEHFEIYLKYIGGQ